MVFDTSPSASQTGCPSLQSYQQCVNEWACETLPPLAVSFSFLSFLYIEQVQHQALLLKHSLIWLLLNFNLYCLLSALSFVQLLILALSVKNRFCTVVVKSSGSLLTQTWFRSSLATQELCDLGHKGLGKCRQKEWCSQPEGLSWKAESWGVWQPGYIQGMMGQPQSLASSHKAAVSLAHLGVFNGIWSESRWHKASYLEFLSGNKTQTPKSAGTVREGLWGG